mgnify:CR=1 FL=1
MAAMAFQAEAAVGDYTKQHPLLFGIDMDYPPMEYVDAQGKPSGYDVEFTTELMRRLNIPFTFSPNTWENISDDVLSGNVDLGMMVYSPYRKDSTNYSKAVFRLYYQIVYPKKDTSRFDVRNLANKHVAYMSSRPVRDTLTRVGAILHETTDLSKATIDLSKGKYDAVVCYRYQAKYLLNKYKLANLEAEDITLAAREYCYVSHDKQLIDAINVELAKMEQEGVVDDIYGDVYSSFDGINIPAWIWYLLVALIFVFLIVFIVGQQVYQRRLRLEMRRAQLGEQMKTAFLGNVSHALRTPLNAIIGFSDILKEDDGVLPPDERRHLSHLINDNGRQLLYFVNELLELSDIEGHELQLNRSEVTLDEVMNGYADEVRGKLAEGVTLQVDGHVDCHVIIDEQMMRLVTMHFLENAVRHTSKGTVTLIYRVADGQMYIAVKDTGKGVPEALRENIFNILTDKAAYVQDVMPGLGMTICKAIVERCGGHIGLETPAEGGALFWHSVPVRVV